MIMALVRTVVSLLKICPASYSATQNILCDVDFVLMKLSKNIWLFSFLQEKKLSCILFQSNQPFECKDLQQTQLNLGQAICIRYYSFFEYIFYMNNMIFHHDTFLRVLLLIFSSLYSFQMNIWRHGAPDDTSSAVCNSTPPNTTTTTILLFAVLLESLNFAACVVVAAALLQYIDAACYKLT